MNFWGFWKRYSPDRPALVRIGVVLLAPILAWQAPAPAIAQEAGCGSFAVAVAPQEVGYPLSDNSIRLVDTTDDPTMFAFDQPGTVTPAPRPGVALLRSLGGIYSLFDKATGKVMPIQISEDQQRSIDTTLPAIRNAANADFMLLSNGPAGVWLVELSTGKAVDLVTLLPKGNYIDSASVAAGGTWVEFFSKDTGYLISLETAGDPIEISSEPTLPYPGFDVDGSALIYATKGDTWVTVWSRDLKTGSAEIIGKTASANYLDATASDTVLLLDGQRLLALAGGALEPKSISTWEGAPFGIFGDISGRFLLIGAQQDNGVAWVWVDTETDETITLDELTDMIPLQPGRRQDAITFLPSPRQGPGSPGASYRTVDLTTGAVATVLTQDSTEVWLYSTGGDDAGRYTLISAVSPGTGRMWLIDGQLGSSTQIGTSTGNLLARVSPDGCQLAVAVFDAVGEGRTSVVTVTSLIDGSTVTTIPDSILLGWAETGTTE